MKQHSRRYKQVLEQITKQNYDPIQAIQLLKRISNANFVETAEVHIALGIDPKYVDQQLRATVILPKGIGKTINIAVITRGQQLSNAISAGADIAGADDLIDKISKGSINFDKLITTPDMMPLIAKLGRQLGPRGLMPSPKAGTVTNNLRQAIIDFKLGKLEYRVDRTGIVHVPFGKISFSVNDLILNMIALKESIEKNRPSGAKGKYWKSVYISSTMSPSIAIDVNRFREIV